MSKLSIPAIVVGIGLMVLHTGLYAQTTSTTAASKKDSAKNKIVPAVKKEIILPTPEFINQPYYYDKNDNRLIKLESVTAQMSTKKKTLGLKGAKQLLTISGGSSKVRFTSKNNISFFIKTSGDVIDLTSYIKLYRFTVNNENREAEISSKDGLLNNNDQKSGRLINLSVKMIAKDVYMIQAADNLEAGEYGFVWVKNMELKEFTAFTFGIDWRNSD